MSDSDSVTAGADDGDDECTAYVRDDVAREYSRAFPDEQMSMKVEDGGGWVG